MGHIFTLFSFCIFFHTVANCQSQQKEIVQPRLSVGLETTLPVNDMNLTNSFGAGISLKTVTPFASFAGISFSGGAIRYFGKKNFGTKETAAFFCFPLKAGLRLFARKGIYAEPQVGYSIISSKVGSEGAFCYAGNMGCLINYQLDISLQYESMAKYRVNFSNVGLRVAYSF